MGIVLAASSADNSADGTFNKLAGMGAIGTVVLIALIALIALVGLGLLALLLMLIGWVGVLAQYQDHGAIRTALWAVVVLCLPLLGTALWAMLGRGRPRSAKPHPVTTADDPLLPAARALAA